MKYFKGKYIQQGGIFDPIFGDFEGMAYLPGNFERDVGAICS